MKYISMKDYKRTEEYRDLIACIDSHLESKRRNFHIPKYNFYNFVQPSRVEDIMDAYDIPFFDKFTTMYYHEDGKLILNLTIFYYQLEFFMKSLFIRIFWFNGRENKDKFAEFIWDEYCNSGDEHFIALKEQALQIFNECETIEEFYGHFVLNEEYTFIQYRDYQEMVEKTFKSCGYNFIMPSLVEFPENSVQIFENRQATKYDRILTDVGISQLRLIGMHNKLNVHAKYNFVPSDKTQALKHFNFSLVTNKGIFFPQLLVFPK
jgi:uncharacterized protein YutD